MCGIVGMASKDGPIDAALVAAQCGVLQHRGPDDTGVWLSDTCRVALGHRRLAIIDLSPAGHQPMTSHDGSLHIVYNGEIYNFEDLRGELETYGHRFRSRSDTEVLLAGYDRWGDELLPRLNGMFALALMDGRTNRLLLARDRAGEKPLYYVEDRHGLRFASELKALFADPGLPRVMDGEALEHYLAYGYVSSDHSMIAGVRKLRPAHALSFDLQTGTSRQWRYWSLPEAAAGAEPDDMLVAQLEELLSDAVRRQLVADVPVGVLLSGGTDSSIIAAIAAKLRGRNIKTFTVSFPGHQTYDESAYARLVARHIGTDHTELPARPADIDLVPLLARQFDDPIGDSSMVPTYIVSRLIRDHATVAIGGDGGDELFGGYPHYILAHRHSQIRSILPSPVRAAVAGAARRLPLGVRGRNHLIGSAGDACDALAHFNMFFDAAARDRLLGRGRDRASREAPERLKKSLCVSSAPIVEQSARVDFQTYLPDDILTKVDRASMLASLEVRAPFLDVRVIEFAFGRLSQRQRTDGRSRKILLRQLGKRLLPPELDLTRKQGFSIPLSAWLRGSWGGYFEDVLMSSPTALFKRREIIRLVRNQKRGLANAERMFALTILELWRQEYNVSLPAS